VAAGTRRRHTAGYPVRDSVVGTTYARFLELPVPLVLSVLWLLGAALLGAAAIGVYSAWTWLPAALAAI
jgi:hypothetical protein